MLYLRALHSFYPDCFSGEEIAWFPRFLCRFLASLPSISKFASFFLSDLKMMIFRSLEESCALPAVRLLYWLEWEISNLILMTRESQTNGEGSTINRRRQWKVDFQRRTHQWRMTTERKRNTGYVTRRDWRKLTARNRKLLEETERSKGLLMRNEMMLKNGEAKKWRRIECVVPSLFLISLCSSLTLFDWSSKGFKALPRGRSWETEVRLAFYF